MGKIPFIVLFRKLLTVLTGVKGIKTRKQQIGTKILILQLLMKPLYYR